MMFARRKLITEPTADVAVRGMLNLPWRRAPAAPDAAEQQAAAFESLLEQCWEPLWRYAYHSTGNAEDAGDLLSETAIGGFKGFAKFRGETTFLRWMYRIMTTTRIDMVRKNGRHAAASLDMLDEEGEFRHEAIADASANPEVVVLEPMLSEPMQKALNGLSEEYRAVVVLADIEQLEYLEVSQTLQIPVGTVRSRLHRARVHLRKALSEYVEDSW